MSIIQDPQNYRALLTALGRGEPETGARMIAETLQIQMDEEGFPLGYGGISVTSNPRTSTEAVESLQQRIMNAAKVDDPQIAALFAPIHEFRWSIRELKGTGIRTTISLRADPVEAEPILEAIALALNAADPANLTRIVVAHTCENDPGRYYMGSENMPGASALKSLGGSGLGEIAEALLERLYPSPKKAVKEHDELGETMEDLFWPRIDLQITNKT